MNAARIQIRHADSSTAIVREQRYAHGEKGGAVSLDVSRERGAYEVRWNVNRGRAWRASGWVARNLTEERATALAEAKWAELVTWLEKLEPEAHGGAPACFSQQVASMSR